MEILAESEILGVGQPTKTDTPSVHCPECHETVYTERIGEVTCDSCENRIHATNHEWMCAPAMECQDCKHEISFILEHRGRVANWETFFCHHCNQYIGFQQDQEAKSLADALRVDWIFERRGTENVGTEIVDGYRVKAVETDREKLAVGLLNQEAKKRDSSFNLYNPDTADAYICLSQEYCIGYITWEKVNGVPQFGQIFIIPEYRGQGIGTGFADAWRENEVGGCDGLFKAHEPNPDGFRLLRRMGVVEVGEEKLHFDGVEITGTWHELPPEWGPN